MSDGFIPPGKTEHVAVFATDGTNKLTGVTWTLKIVRLSDGKFWNGSAWQTNAVTVNMVEVSAANRPGEYGYDFSPPDSGYLCTLLAETSNTSVTSRFQAGTLDVGYGMPKDASLARKFIRNKTNIANGNYTVYEDDKSTVLETGTVSSTDRVPST